jgi:hypothetical protein
VLLLPEILDLATYDGALGMPEDEPSTGVFLYLFIYEISFAIERMRQKRHTIQRVVSKKMSRTASFPIVEE